MASFSDLRPCIRAEVDKVVALAEQMYDLFGSNSEDEDGLPDTNVDTNVLFRDTDDDEPALVKKTMPVPTPRTLLDPQLAAPFFNVRACARSTDVSTLAFDQAQPKLH
jgi:hypothetical protein